MAYKPIPSDDLTLYCSFLHASHTDLTVPSAWTELPSDIQVAHSPYPVLSLLKDECLSEDFPYHPTEGSNSHPFPIPTPVLFLALFFSLALIMPYVLLT